MSHTTTIKGLAIKDATAIRTAVAKLKQQGVNIDLKENAEPRMYYNNQFKRDTGKNKAEFVLHLPGAEYDVGLSLQEDGSYAPIFDEFNGSVARHLGANCARPSGASERAQHQIGKFMQAYAVDAATNAAIAQGYYVESSEIDQQGNVHLTLAGM